MAQAQTTILNLDTETLANLKSSGYTVVSVNGKTYKMALKDITDVTDAKAEASALTAETARATAAEATKANAADIPTKTSDLENDSGFLTEVGNWENASKLFSATSYAVNNYTSFWYNEKLKLMMMNALFTPNASTEARIVYENTSFNFIRGVEVNTLVQGYTYPISIKVNAYNADTNANKITVLSSQGAISGKWLCMQLFVLAEKIS